MILWELVSGDPCGTISSCMRTWSNVAASIEGWLLDSGIQVASGGVAGWIDNAGIAEFVYPEITGYYLTWLDFAQISGGLRRPQILQNLTEARHWIVEAYSDGEPPPTRVYLNGNDPDWRNECAFSFDLTMVWRGLVSLADGEPRAQNALRRIIDEIRHMTRGSDLAACRVLRNGKCSIPQRWSTEAGPYQTKIAAALLASPVRLPEDLVSIAGQVFRRWRNWFDERPLDGDLHALLYYLEGLTIAGVSFDPVASAVAARIYSRLLDEKRPQFLGSHNADFRSDILAQALRVGAAVQHRLDNNTTQLLSSLAEVLISFVVPEGGVLLQRPAQGCPPRLSAWSAMFSHQAIRFFARSREGNIVPDNWVLRLV